MKVHKLCALALSAAIATAPAQAAVIGWFDAIDMQMVDNGFGWICESTDPNTAPPGNLVVYIDGPAGVGQLYLEYSVASMWGALRLDVPQSGQCGSNNNTGWNTGAAYLSAHPTIHVYYRDTGGTLHELNGSPKDCTGQPAPGYCT
jgi:hypothetical protein